MFKSDIYEILDSETVDIFRSLWVTDFIFKPHLLDSHDELLNSMVIGPFYGDEIEPNSYYKGILLCERQAIFQEDSCAGAEYTITYYNKYTRGINDFFVVANKIISNYENNCYEFKITTKGKTTSVLTEKDETLLKLSFQCSILEHDVLPKRFLFIEFDTFDSTRYYEYGSYSFFSIQNENGYDVTISDKYKIEHKIDSRKRFEINKAFSQYRDEEYLLEVILDYYIINFSKS